LEHKKEYLVTLWTNIYIQMLYYTSIGAQPLIFRYWQKLFLVISEEGRVNKILCCEEKIDHLLWVLLLFIVWRKDWEVAEFCRCQFGGRVFQTFNRKSWRSIICYGWRTDSGGDKGKSAIIGDSDRRTECAVSEGMLYRERIIVYR